MQLTLNAACFFGKMVNGCLINSRERRSDIRNSSCSQRLIWFLQGHFWRQAFGQKYTIRVIWLIFESFEHYSHHHVRHKSRNHGEIFKKIGESFMRIPMRWCLSVCLTIVMASAALPSILPFQYQASTKNCSKYVKTCNIICISRLLKAW